MRFVPIAFATLMSVGCAVQQPPTRLRDAEPVAESKAEPAAPVVEAKNQETQSAGTAAGSDWKAFLGPFGTSVSPEKGLHLPWPADGPRLIWQQALGMGYGAPAVSDGKLFIGDRRGGVARLKCFESRTGKPLWKYEYPSDYRDYFGYNNGPRACPVVDGDRVYFYGADGVLSCVRTEDGKPIWKIDTRAEFHVVQNFFGVASAPVIEKDLLIVVVGGCSTDSDPTDFARLKGNGTGIVAFDKVTGKVRYKITNELAGYSSPVLATIGGRRWCFSFARGGLVGFEPATGKVDFHFPWRCPDLESVNASNPVVVGDQVFISETYGPGSALLKVRPGGYDVVWTDEKKRARAKSMQCHWNTPIFHDGYLYGCSGRHPDNAELRCIELATGKVIWNKRGLTRTSLLMVDGHFICLAEDGTIRLLKVNPHRYEEIAHADTGLLQPPCWAAPILSHGLMYLRDEHRVVCLELIGESK